MAAAVGCWLSCAAPARGQGGPPMITDDPGTPGNGNWENNVAIAFSHVPGEWALDAPGLDLNYGWGDHIQLTLQTSAALLKRGDHGLVGGMGGTEVAVKWRFLDEERNGVDVSMFPRILFNVVHSSVRRGLAEDGTRFQIPFQVAKKFGAIRQKLSCTDRSINTWKQRFLCQRLPGLASRYRGRKAHPQSAPDPGAHSGRHPQGPARR